VSEWELSKIQGHDGRGESRGKSGGESPDRGSRFAQALDAKEGPVHAERPRTYSRPEDLAVRGICL